MFSPEKGLGKILRLNLEGSYQFEIDLWVGEIRHLNESIEKINEEIKKRGGNLPGHKNLTSIKGISDTRPRSF